MGIQAKGEILLPKEKKRIPIVFDEEAKKEIQDTLLKLNELIESPIPSPPKWIGVCSKCGFAELCWAGEE
jgi:CRISPR-associated exonuclease Cas4